MEASHFNVTWGFLFRVQGTEKGIEPSLLFGVWGLRVQEGIKEWKTQRNQVTLLRSRVKEVGTGKKISTTIFRLKDKGFCKGEREGKLYAVWHLRFSRD